MAREKLGLDPGELGSPWKAAGSSFAAVTLGASVPLAPFVFAAGAGATLTSALLSAFALAAVGAAISVFTGRSAVLSAVRMVAIGGGAALVTYLVGTLIGVAV